MVVVLFILIAIVAVIFILVGIIGGTLSMNKKKYCPYCSSQINNNAVYCEKCGKNV